MTMVPVQQNVTVFQLQTLTVTATCVHLTTQVSCQATMIIYQLLALIMYQWIMMMYQLTAAITYQMIAEDAEALAQFAVDVYIQTA